MSRLAPLPARGGSPKGDIRTQKLTPVVKPDRSKSLEKGTEKPKGRSQQKPREAAPVLFPFDELENFGKTLLRFSSPQRGQLRQV